LVLQFYYNVDLWISFIELSLDLQSNKVCCHRIWVFRLCLRLVSLPRNHVIFLNLTVLFLWSEIIDVSKTSLSIDMSMFSPPLRWQAVSCPEWHLSRLCYTLRPRNTLSQWVEQHRDLPRKPEINQKQTRCTIAVPCAWAGCVGRWRPRASTHSVRTVFARYTGRVQARRVLSAGRP